MNTYITIGAILSIGLILSISYANGQQNETETNIIQWKTYSDPDGEYTIDYPSNWNLNPKENRFDEKELELNTIDESGNSVHIGIKTMDQPNLDLEEKSDDFAQLLATGIPNFKEIEPMECEKYTVSENIACSIVFTGDIWPQSAVLQLYTMMEILNIY